jgi:hypothetical protein
LPDDVSIVSNIDGLTGGIKLWREDLPAPPATAGPSLDVGDDGEPPAAPLE